MKRTNAFNHFTGQQVSRVGLIAMGLLVALTAEAARVGYAGADLTTRGAWRTPSVLKLLDRDGDNIYGTDGFVLATSPGGDLLQNPSYAFVTRLATYGYYGGNQTTPRYVSVDNPDGGSVYAGLWMSTGTTNLQEQDLGLVEVSAAASFRVGVLVDQADYVDLSPKGLRLRQVQGGAADSGLTDCYLEPNLDGDWYFFDVVGAQAGDRFVLSGSNLRAGGPFQDGNGIGGMTIDQIPGGAAQELQLYAGLRITGTVGTVYSIDYLTDLGQSNNPSAWRCLEYLRLPASPYLWIDRSAPATGRRFYRSLEFPAPRNMVFIRPGTFRMGSPDSEVDRQANEGPQTIVTISREFWMGKYEVTQAEFQAVIGHNPSFHRGDPSSMPVEFLDRGSASNYCMRLTVQERNAGRIAANSLFRLPTEAEWEYACRGWTSTRFSYGDDPGYADLADYAWFYVPGTTTTYPVGQKLPNPWGLYDMHGNVNEWCLDVYPTLACPYPGGEVIDPQGYGTGQYQIVRGGNRTDTAERCRSAARRVVTYSASSETGFRVVLESGEP